MASGLRIRPFDPSDATACCWIINANVELMDGLNPAARRVIVSKNVPDLLSLELESMYTVVAEENDELLGVAALDGLELKRFHVARLQQRRGIGSALLMELEAYARAEGRGRLELLASPSAASFYAAHGYVSLGERRGSSGPAEFVNVHMEKRL